MIITHEMQVQLTYITPAFLPGVVARNCYGNATRPHSVEDNLGLSQRLLKAGHHEPLECSLVVFQCTLPKFVCNQLNRHRIGIGRCQQSLRFSFAEPTFFWPRDIPLSQETERRFAGDEQIICSLKEEHAKKREREIHQRLISDNIMVQYSTWFNMRQWLSLAQKRLDSHAQKETQEVVRMMQEQIMATDWKEIFGGKE